MTDEEKQRKAQAAQEIIQKETWHMPHPIWTENEVKDVKITHLQPSTIGDSFANIFIQSLRLSFDIMSGYKQIFPWQDKTKPISEKKWLNRMLFLETVAGVPGFVAAMHRHLTSLRNMQRDYGWIHTLLEEAENERMHLLTFMKVQKPSPLFRMGVVFAQFGYVGLFSILYMFFPKVCHRVVGYLEEEAVKTYTHCIEVINQEGSPISHWKTMVAPQISRNYWYLSDNASLLDVIYAIRKDEEHHRDVNHTLADKQILDKNQFPPGH
ncbi:hypothetical protein IMG5_166890 [Ichthyophthirius multifiliis]|uniref:Alternative oxidase n=1 Tax=Ichthyophthirius multifiliis TaxID=5932 RepID=G0R0T6_ICHMU|nr:hypothetical protein IMG5_166890 [Ichthyophthirius multifiliis]EGR28896.1 hypothetical protein IMG5_166890 [Ichthyophthirius multifiliis]|eukprot:XP_004030132.1 hypothetical protein IMG5_166890 [Ichthyophthirius multifiliis]